MSENAIQFPDYSNSDTVGALKLGDGTAACGFIQPYILQKLADSQEVPEKTRDASARTLSVGQNIRDKRAALTSEVNARPVPTEGNRSIYDCKESENIPGTLVRGEGEPRVKDRAVNDVYDGFEITSKFFSTIFGRNSIDNAGLKLIGSVHFQKGFNNAAWDGKQMLFGDGDGIFFDELTDSLDVISHELTHGVTQYTAKLLYWKQAGALNESMSDVFACMVEQWHFGQTAEQGDWILGQNVWPVGRRGAALRSLKAPGTAYDDSVLGKDPQPAHMRDYVDTTEDGGGVHLNSGIPNHAFYLCAVGFGGHSWERAGRIWYKTLTDPRIQPDCTFKQFADLTVDNARVLFGDPSMAAVKNAWVSVGVLA